MQKKLLESTVNVLNSTPSAALDREIYEKEATPDDKLQQERIDVYEQAKETKIIVLQESKDFKQGSLVSTIGGAMDVLDESGNSLNLTKVGNSAHVIALGAMGTLAAGATLYTLPKWGPGVIAGISKGLGSLPTLAASVINAKTAKAAAGVCTSPAAPYILAGIGIAACTVWGAKEYAKSELNSYRPDCYLLRTNGDKFSFAFLTGDYGWHARRDFLPRDHYLVSNDTVAEFFKKGFSLSTPNLVATKYAGVKLVSDASWFEGKSGNILYVELMWMYKKWLSEIAKFREELLFAYEHTDKSQDDLDVAYNTYCDDVKGIIPKSRYVLLDPYANYLASVGCDLNTKIGQVLCSLRAMYELALNSRTVSFKCKSMTLKRMDRLSEALNNTAAVVAWLMSLINIKESNLVDLSYEELNKAWTANPIMNNNQSVLNLGCLNRTTLGIISDNAKRKSRSSQLRAIGSKIGVLPMKAISQLGGFYYGYQW